MKRKHKDAMIAMGIKISALEQIQRNHGQAHMAQDLLPQFRELCKEVEILKGQLNFKLNDGPIANHSRRIANLEETAESLSETVDQLSTCQIYSEQIKTLVREVETLKIQMGNTILHTNKLMEGFISQQEINNGVQRDLRIITSPGYKKEIAAQKQDAKSKKAK